MKSQDSVARNSVYAEVLGNAVGLSLNYDRIVLKKEKISMSFCIGAATNPINFLGSAFFNKPKFVNSPLIYGVPVSCNMIYGRGNQHFEVGVGLTYNQGYSMDINYLHEVVYYSREIFAVIRLGYRFQKKDGGLFWKLGFTPYFLIKDYIVKTDVPELSPSFISVPKVIPMGGIAIGYTFRN